MLYTSILDIMVNHKWKMFITIYNRIDIDNKLKRR